MDGETVRLVATAAGAVIAGLGGAGIAGWFNSKNTKATIEAAKVQAGLVREQEHAQWLRDRKVRCYADFLAHMREIDTFVSNFHGNKPSDVEPVLTVIRTLGADELMLVAPRHIYTCAVTVMANATAVVRTAIEAHLDSERANIYSSAVSEFISKYGTLERLIRQDLGVEELPVETAA
jgi:hypothetical protein